MRGRSKGLLRMKNLNRGQELVRTNKFVLHVLQKQILGCGDPRCKHENHGIIMSTDEKWVEMYEKLSEECWKWLEMMENDGKWWKMIGKWWKMIGKWLKMHDLSNDEMKMVMKVTNIYKHEK